MRKLGLASGHKKVTQIQFVFTITVQIYVFQEEKRKIFSYVLDADQSMSFTLPEGTMADPVDMKRFLYETPYDHAYGEDISH